ncbi:MAG: translocation protein TolB [Terriglobales bacterium]
MRPYRILWCLLGLALALGAQDQTQITITGPAKYNTAVPNFNPGAGVPAAVQDTFNSVLWNDLHQSAVVNLVGRSLYTAPTPAAETDLNNPAVRSAWTAPPLSIQRLIFGNLQTGGGGLVVEGFLYNVTELPGSGRLLARRYANPATPAGARAVAHQFANDVIAALGFGPGIATSQIAFISNRSGHKEVWTMDYDGYNQQQRTHLNSIAYSPRISPDGQKLAFASFATGRWQIKVLSLLTNKLLPFPTFSGSLNESPAWSPDGKQLAFASNMNGPLDIFVTDGEGRHLRRLTYSKGGSDSSPAWNPKPPAGSSGQIAFVSDRAGLPQIYTMNADGSNQQRVALGGGYAVSPSWSPNGLSLAFAWVRTGGGENSGASDVYFWYFGGQNYVQLTHNQNRNDFPSWAPDNRHLVFESGPPYRTQLFSVAADGSVPMQLTTAGDNEMPNWSWH